MGSTWRDLNVRFCKPSNGWWNRRAKVYETSGSSSDDNEEIHFRLDGYPWATKWCTPMALWYSYIYSLIPSIKGIIRKKLIWLHLSTEHHTVELISKWRSTLVLVFSIETNIHKMRWGVWSVVHTMAFGGLHEMTLNSEPSYIGTDECRRNELNRWPDNQANWFRFLGIRFSEGGYVYLFLCQGLDGYAIKTYLFHIKRTPIGHLFDQISLCFNSSRFNIIHNVKLISFVFRWTNHQIDD